PPSTRRPVPGCSPPEMTVSPRLATGTSSAMTGGAVVAVEYDHVGRANRLARLRSDGPFRVRPGGANGFDPWTGGARDVARVAVSAATAGPLGGDRLAFEVAVGDGATLVLVDTSATLVLPGVHGEPSRVDYRVRVGDDATL